jgi:hypothetical protein
MPDDDAFSVWRIIAGLGLGFALGILVPVFLVTLAPRVSDKSVWAYPAINAALLGLVMWVSRTGYDESGFVRGLIIALAIMSSLSVICGGIMFFIAR